MKGQRFFPTEGKLKILENLARYEILTARWLATLIAGNDEHPTITVINKTLTSLHNEGLINRIYFRPEKYLGRGNLPNASGLSDKGVALAAEKWPETYPKQFPATHSPHTIQHDIERAEAHIAIKQLSEAQGWALGWKKGGYHIVKPDDVFEITGTKTSHFFLEKERHRKDFMDMFDKLEPFVLNHGSGEMKNFWGFKYYNVLIPMRTGRSMLNLLSHLKGVCNCVDPNHKRKHAKKSYKLITDILWFTTQEEITKNTTGRIFHTPKDNTHSFLDIIR